MCDVFYFEFSTIMFHYFHLQKNKLNSRIPCRLKENKFFILKIKFFHSTSIWMTLQYVALFCWSSCDTRHFSFYYQARIQTIQMVFRPKNMPHVRNIDFPHSYHKFSRIGLGIWLWSWRMQDASKFQDFQAQRVYRLGSSEEEFLHLRIFLWVSHIR